MSVNMSCVLLLCLFFFFFFQAEDGIRDRNATGVQTCALPIWPPTLLSTKPVMIYVFSDGSLTSTGMVDSSVGGRGKLGWQGDNSSVASTFFQIGRASCRERVEMLVGAGGMKRKCEYVGVESER